MNMLWNFRQYGDREALIDDTGASIRYNKLEELQRKLAEIDPGQLTMMICKNSLGALSGYAALLNCGHPMLLVSTATPEDMRRQIMNTYRPRLIYAPRDLHSEYAHMQEIQLIDDYMLLRTNFAELFPVHSDLGLMLSTSGSTGSVRFVRQSWCNIRFNAQAHADYLQITDQDRTITALPMSYTYGLSIINANLWKGATLVVTSQGIMDKEFWDLFVDEHITAFHGVPGTYDMLYRLEFFSEDFPDLRLMTQAGGKLSLELQRYFAQYAKEYGKRFIIMYGQCEATAAISYLPADKALLKPGSVGIAIPGGEIELQDEKGNPVQKASVPGELIYRGKNVTLGYAVRGEDLIRGDDWHGILRTGDIAEKDEDGFLYITGRMKRIIKMAGHRISLDEMDERIFNDLHIRCVSTGEDDHPVIFVLNENDQAAVLEYVRLRISLIRSAVKVCRIDAFPTNEAGKILFGELQKMAAKQIV